MKHWNFKNLEINTPLIDSLDKIFFDALMSVKGQTGSLFIGSYYIEDTPYDLTVDVLEQDLKDYILYFKKLKKNCIDLEFVLCLNAINNNILKIQNRIKEYNVEFEYYNEFNFNYQKVNNFINRYISIYKKNNFNILYNYCLDLQKELFQQRFDLNERYEIIKRNLETIYFNEKYGKKEQFFFGGLDFGKIVSFNQIDIKTYFENEFKKDEFNKLKEIKSSNTNDYNVIDVTKNKLVWNGSQTQFIELIKALVESDSIKGENQKNIIDLFSKFLNFNIDNPNKLIQDIKKRNNGSETLFLDKLKTELLNFIIK